MLNALTLFACNGDTPEFDALVAGMEAAPFVACTPTQERSFGWVPPRGEDHGTLLEAVAGQWIAALQIEDRTVPGPVIKRALKAKVDEIEKATGRKPKGKLLKKLKDEVRHELMPRAFSKLTIIPVWIDTARKLVGVATTGSTKADMVAMALVESGGAKMNLHRLQTAVATDSCMTAWLLNQVPPPHFTVDRDAELRDLEENAGVVSLTNVELFTDEVQQRIQQGMRAQKLAMTYKARVSFTLRGNGTINGINLLDVTLSGDKEVADAFDANVALYTGELADLLADLIAAMGGPLATPVEEAAKEQPGAESAPAKPPEHFGPASEDPMYQQAVAVVLAERRASISLVQRHLRIGYNRAARLLERMEEDGTVSAMGNDGIRTVLAQGEPA